ncbi:ribosomal-protein-alanine N-acetyltransferase [Moraxella cuniculi DSM 21768]|uniref:Ribosomal-protein-alanine N-acetyltransferase n=1 Tax=Moraxella cuniculi DSM 21768 TaxID=1122245 RepID=A0A1N7FNB8_9GAMM|nr:GNAT family N-acetyltransferase [Moraxella cuniculi]OOS04719.1 hypothetical protein B0189_07940 [Moraxella cuniculi]SIS01852.1 ribosomal-protein-alanine N-acetyltransferase [Moraxella cuniculi DSM 21768]
MVVILDGKTACQWHDLLEHLAYLEQSALPDDAWQVGSIKTMLGQFGAAVAVVVAAKPIDGAMRGDCLQGEAATMWLQQSLADNQLSIVAYCLFQVVFETAEIHRIGTHPDYHRRGLATRLMTAVNQSVAAAGAERLLLEVRADNVAAIGLYQRQGFEPIDVREGYYRADDGQSVDALIMQQRIHD